MLGATIEKNISCLFKKTVYVSFRQRIAMGKSKKKPFMHILVYSNIFRHNQAYSGIIQAYSQPCITLAYLEPWYAQNPGIVRTRSIWRIVGYSETRHIQNPAKHLRWDLFAKIVNGYNYYYHNISFSRFLLYESSVNFFKIGLIFTQEVFIRCKNVWDPKRHEAEGHEFFIYLLVDVFK